MVELAMVKVYCVRHPEVELLCEICEDSLMAEPCPVCLDESRDWVNKSWLQKAQEVYNAIK